MFWGDEGSHGLHQGAGDQHGEIDDLAGHAVAGGSLQTQTVDEGAEGQEGKLGQELLQCQRQADAQELAALGVQTEIGLVEGEGQVLLQQHHHGADHADGLRKDGGHGRTGGVQMQTGHQNQVADDVAHAGHQHEKQGRLAVAQPAEDGGQQVIGHDEEDAAAADPHIAGGQVHGLGGGLHQHRDGAGKAHHDHEQHGRDQGKDHGGPADDLPDVLGLLLAQVPGDEDGDAHGELRHHKGDQVQNLTAGGDGGQAGGGAEAAHHQKVHSTIGGLQDQCAQDRQHEEAELFQDAALSKIGFIVFHRGIFFH